MSFPTPKPIAAIWAGWAVAAILIVVSSFLTAAWLGTRAQLVVQKDQAELNDLEVRSLRQSLEANQIVADRQINDLKNGSSLDQLQLVALEATEGDGHAIVATIAWDQLKQQGVLVAERLPKLTGDESYQIWGTNDADQQFPIDAFTLDEKGRARLRFHPAAPIGKATGFIITRFVKSAIELPQPHIASGRIEQ